MSGSSRIVLADALSAVAAWWFGDTLKGAFAHPGGWGVLAGPAGFLAFCAAIALVRRLPNDGRLERPETSLKTIGGLTGLSTLLSTVTLLAVIAWGAGLGAQPGRELPGAVAFVGSLVVAALLFAPLALLWAGSPQPLGERHVAAGETSAVLAANLAMAVTVAAFEAFALGVRKPGEHLPAVALTGLVILVPTFLLMCGAPRLLLMARRFSVPAGLSLVVSTAFNLWRAFYR